MNRIQTPAAGSANQVHRTMRTLCVFCLAILLSDYCAGTFAWPWIEFSAAVVISVIVVKPLLHDEKRQGKIIRTAK